MVTKGKYMLRVSARLGIIFLLAAAMTLCVSLALQKASALSKPGRVTLTSAKSAGYNSIKLSWKKAANAKKYQVYCAPSKGGKYKLVGTTSKLTFTHKKLKTGRSYYYKVRGINSSAKGPFSNIKGAVPMLGKPKADVEAYGVECLIVVWESVPGAQYYEIERCSAAADSNYELVGQNEGNSFDDYDLDIPEGGRLNYYYRVRACRRVDSKTYRSAWSNEVCAFLEPENAVLTEGLDVKLIPMQSGNVIAEVRNNNEEAVDVYLKMRFFGDDKEHAVAIADEAFIDLVPGRTVYARFMPLSHVDYETPLRYKDYKLYVSAKELEYDYTDHSDKIDVKIDSIARDLIGFTATNKSGLYISAEVGFIFFDKDNNILDFNTDVILLNGSESTSEVLSTIDLGTQEYDRIEPIVFRAGVL